MNRSGAGGGEAGFAWSPSDPVLGRDDHRPFDGADDLGPLHRLARFVPSSIPVAEPAPEPVGDPGSAGWIDPAAGASDGGSAQPAGHFVEVTCGSLSDVPRIHVFVHGWLPGGLSSAQRSLAVEGRVTRAWDEDLTNQYGKTPVSAYSPLLATLAERDPEAAVLWFSWVDQSATDTSLFAARRSLGRAPINGRRLAAALSQAVWDRADPRQSPGPQVHLIGHSHGSVVAVNAALAMPISPDHLTVLDCPEDWFTRTGGAAGLLSDTLPRLHPSRGPGSTFVDAYQTMFGRQYHDRPGLGNVVDVRVTPVFDPEAIEPRASQAHQYAVTWYCSTVGDPTATAGFAWSPLAGFDPAPLRSSYLVTPGGTVRSVPSRRAADDDVHEHVVTGLRVPTETLTGTSPDLDVLVDLPDDAQLVEFDLSFARCGPDARVDVAVDGRLAFTSFAAAPVPSSGRFVRVQPGRVDLQFRLVDPGPGGSATIARIRVVRDRSARRNADDKLAMMRAGKLGALVGSAATAAVLVSLWGAGRLARRVLR